MDLFNIANWSWPQAIYLILLVVGLLNHAIGHGKPIISKEFYEDPDGEMQAKTVGIKYNFPARLVWSALFLFLLLYGGFFA